MTKGKKGAIGEQVNWIYVMIAGGLILLFFSGLAYKQKEAADKNAAQESINTIDWLTTQPPQSSQIVKIPNLKLRIECQEQGPTTVSNILRIGDISLQENEVIFGGEVNRNELTAMTREWSAPFKVTNLIYLAGNDTRYIIVASNPRHEALAQELFYQIPDSLNKKLYRATDAIDEAPERRIVAVTINSEPANLQNSIDFSKYQEAMAIKIIPSQDSTEYGQVEFRQYDKSAAGFVEPPQTAIYSGISMLIGAIYSQDADSYRCNSKKAYQKLERVSRAYSEKANILKTEAQKTTNRQLPDPCTPGMYNDALTGINSLNSKARAFNENILAEMQSLENKNRELLRAACPTIY
ncbi:hypothetical protein HYY72_00120 [Candidatus Woesearchaeota archaeon]|nr:hypothetical protein [Candidatus Woesearchaeota archaeon]